LPVRLLYRLPIQAADFLMKGLQEMRFALPSPSVHDGKTRLRPSGGELNQRLPISISPVEAFGLQNSHVDNYKSGNHYLPALYTAPTRLLSAVAGTDWGVAATQLP
jgi:hypothetical protein